LIVAGDCYGEVWNVGNGNTYHFTSFLFPRLDFLHWFQWCIESRINISDANDAIEMPLYGDSWDEYLKKYNVDKYDRS
jgi:hypothetical protein